MTIILRLLICSVAAVAAVTIAIAAQETFLGRPWQAITGLAGAIVVLVAWRATRSLKAPRWARVALPRLGNIEFPALTLPGAIVTAAALLALTLAFMVRWELQVVSPGVVRMDRWSGSVSLCELTDTPVMKCDAPPQKRLLSDKEVFGGPEAWGAKPLND
jgi:hypothetical protein